MSRRLCLRLGAIAGGSVGLLVGLLHGFVCCSPPQPPAIPQLMLYGLIASLIAVFLAAALICLIKKFPVGPVFLLALIIAVIVGLLLGPLAYQIPNPGLALFICAVLGGLLGWIICWLLCGRRGQRWGFQR
jgi:hypothetical protein